MEGKTALGASSPAKPALHMPEPLSTTKAATSSSHMLDYLMTFKDNKMTYPLHGFKISDKADESIYSFIVTTEIETRVQSCTRTLQFSKHGQLAFQNLMGCKL